MARLIRYFQMVRHLGLGWILFRIRHALSARFGLLRFKSPARAWEEIEVTECAARFFKDSGIEWNQWDGGKGEQIASDADAIQSADRLLEGEFQLYSHHFLRLTFPPDWHQNPFSGEKAPSDVHWSKLSDFAHGDIKNIWELSRFSWTYVLGRAYARTRDSKYIDAFQALVLDWMKMNPPNMGPNWKCGQEAVLRLVALAWGMRYLRPAEGFSRAFEIAAARLFAASGARVEANLSYALSQKNNHGLNEAAGLWMIGVLYPGLKGADRWKSKGREWLNRQAAELIYPDGSCSQNSLNYERLMVDMLAWCVWLARQTGEVLAPGINDALRRAAEFLYQCQDELSGRLPNYGANDGALLLPLTDADYADFRPSLQVAFYLLDGTRRYAPGLYDEALLYFFGNAAMEAPLDSRTVRTDLSAETTGCHTLRESRGFVFFRCGRHVHRPSHADQLHVDVWWRGENIAGDAGTYSYNPPVPCQHAFKETKYHNTVEVDQQCQMDKASRFLWLPWSKGTIVDQGVSDVESGARVRWITGEHDGYRRLEDPVSHKRKVVALGDCGFLIIDRLHGSDSSVQHQFMLNWLLTSHDPELQALTTDGGLQLLPVGSGAGDSEPVQCRILAQPAGNIQLLRGAEGEGSDRVCQSRYYMDLQSASRFSCSVVAPECLFVTFFGPAAVEVALKDEMISISMKSGADFEISARF